MQIPRRARTHGLTVKLALSWPQWNQECKENFVLIISNRRDETSKIVLLSSSSLHLYGTAFVIVLLSSELTYSS